MNNTDDIISGFRDAQHQLLDYMQTHWRLFLCEGFFFILLGFAAIIIPQLFSAFVSIFLGWLILIGGLTHISRALFFYNMPGFSSWLGLGSLQLLVGFLLIADPIAGVLTITMMITLFFAVEGIIKIYMAVMMRPLPHWDYVLASGMTAVMLAGIILAYWSEIPQWVLGVFVGINMLVLGMAMVKISLQHKGNVDAALQDRVGKQG